MTSNRGCTSPVGCKPLNLKRLSIIQIGFVLPYKLIHLSSNIKCKVGDQDIYFGHHFVHVNNTAIHFIHNVLSVVLVGPESLFMQTLRKGLLLI